MIWIHLICNNFIIFRLYAKQLLAQHIPLPGYTALPSPWNLPDDLTEPFFTGVAILLTQPNVQFPCHFWSTVPSWTHCRMQVFSDHKLQTTDAEYLTV